MTYDDITFWIIQSGEAPHAARLNRPNSQIGFIELPGSKSNQRYSANIDKGTKQRRAQIICIGTWFTETIESGDVSRCIEQFDIVWLVE